MSVKLKIINNHIYFTHTTLILFKKLSLIVIIIIFFIFIISGNIKPKMKTNKFANCSNPESEGNYGSFYYFMLTK